MKHFLLITFFTIALCGNSIAQKKEASKDALPAVASFARCDPARFPAPKGWTNDFEGIFTSVQVFELDSIINGFEAATTHEITIVTIDSSLVTKECFDDFTLALSNHWGVGKKDKNNGILIGISTGLRRIRIQNGYGIEAIVTDVETKKIIDSIIIPEFKKADYFEGVKKGLQALIRELVMPGK